MKRVCDTLTKQYLLKLDAVDIYFSGIVDNFYMGARKSNKRGMSLEFSDFKEYTVGDDVRRVDWNSYARTDRLYIKRFEEEKQLTVNIFLDTSKSMDYGDENKAYYAKLMTASIAYVALKNSDSVSIFLCNEHLKLEKKDISNKNLFINIITFLDDIYFDGKTSLSKTISMLSNSKVKKGISFILSDFFSQDGYSEGIKSLKYKNQELIIMHILSPQELFPQDEGNIRFIDSETGELCEIAIDEQILEQYKSVLVKLQNEMKEFCSKLGAMYKLIPTDSSVIKQLQNLG